MNMIQTAEVGSDEGEHNRKPQKYIWLRYKIKV
jgi:hypothetical protein